jgi:23S rRNA (adenine-N6)-dimethyltransferase
VAGHARPPWGWHCLDRRWARVIVSDAGVQRGDLVLDIGAGSGALTAPLVSSGARVVAVELHPARARQLRDRYEHRPVTVVQADAIDLRLPRRPFHVVANPPFGITTALLRRLLSPGSRLVSAHVVVPRHVARRWVGPDAPGRARWSHTFAISTGRPIPSHAFHPPPPRDSIVLVIHRRTTLTRVRVGNIETTNGEVGVRRQRARRAGNRHMGAVGCSSNQ